MPGAAQPADVRVAIVGAGSMGRGLFRQCGLTPGVRCVALADRDLAVAAACAAAAGDYRVVETVGALEEAAAQGVLAVCADGLVPAMAAGSEVFLEASSAIAAGGESCERAIEHGKHLVLMNSEVDLVFGPALLELARRRGVTYTSCDGDQHGVLKRLCDEIRFWGFELVLAGNIKGFLDRYANPESIVPEADKRGLTYKMATAYTDGTKLNIEMALLANGLGLAAPRPGMTGPRALQVHECQRLFDLAALRQGGAPVVDYLLGAEPGGGVFAVGHCDDPYQRRMMEYYKMGPGPFFVFYRPYHLCHVEAMKGILEAAAGRPLLEPRCGFRTNVYAYAKRPLLRGEKLDGVGGYACYGLIENCAEESAPGLPICLAEDVVLGRDVERDERIGWADVEAPAARFDFALYERARRASRHLAPY